MLVGHRLAMAADEIQGDAELRGQRRGRVGEGLADRPAQPRDLERRRAMCCPQPFRQRRLPGHRPGAEHGHEPGRARGHPAHGDVDAVHGRAAHQPGHGSLRGRAHLVQADAPGGAGLDHSSPGKAPPSMSRFWPVT